LAALFHVKQVSQKSVVAGLVPAIHVFLVVDLKDVDARA
jgi:hypothetical protein